MFIMPRGCSAHQIKGLETLICLEFSNEDFENQTKFYKVADRQTGLILEVLAGLKTLQAAYEIANAFIYSFDWLRNTYSFC